MSYLSFDVELTWSEAHGKGIGEIRTDDLVFELSGPESMGGRGVGTNPEALLVSAVSSCFTATLHAVLRRTRLPVDSLEVAASGTVTGFPGRTRFARIVVNPTILGGDVGRQEEYVAAATKAHDRCFIGRTLSPDVSYDVGSVRVRGEAAPNADELHVRAARIATLNRHGRCFKIHGLRALGRGEPRRDPCGDAPRTLRARNQA